MTKIKNEEFLWLADKLTNAEYRFAKSMPKNPHWYTLRETWEDIDFVKTVKLLRKYGYELNWHGRKYICFDINGQRYWTMGEPINKNGRPHTILINKATNNSMHPYDYIANVYDDLFNDKNYIEEDYKVLEMIDYHKNESVLDIGCGTGLFVDMTDVNVDKYLGIDPSKKMLEKFMQKHPKHNVVATEFENFYTNKKFDKIIAMYGVASYIDSYAIQRLESFLSSKGKAILMFYKEDYFPETYKKTSIVLNETRITAKEAGFDRKKDFGNYEVVTICK